MNVRAIKTVEAQNAVNRIKMMTKREVIDISTTVPEELVRIRNYMQSDEYLNNLNNKMFFDVVDKMMEYREKVAEEIENLGNVLKGRLTQGINGFLRTKKEITEDFNINFNNEPTIHTFTQNNYKHFKDYLHEIVNL